MSLKDLIAADVSRVLLNEDEMAESATRYPSGDTGSGVTVVGAWFEDEPEKRVTTGELVERRGTWHIASSVPVTLKDSWLISGEVWQTESFEGPNFGSRFLRLVRRDKVSTKRTDGGRLL